MGRFILHYAIFLVGVMGWGQNGFVAKSIEILPTSELSIIGDTNISGFRCVFNTFFLEQCREIVYQRNGNHFEFRNAVLSLRNEGFDCGNKGINKDFHALLNTKEYPKITLELTDLTLESAAKGKARIKINMVGKEQYYFLPLEIVTSPTHCFIGKLRLDIREFGLQPPRKFLGLVVIKEEIEINFNLEVLL